MQSEYKKSIELIVIVYIFFPEVFLALARFASRNDGSRKRYYYL